MQLFYSIELNKNSTEFTFDKVESKHIIKVLRKKEGDVIHITNGENILFKAKIVLASDKKCHVQIIEIIDKKPVRDYTVNIAIAPTKNNNRFEWFLEKSTEIGIDNIYPINCEYSERKTIKLDRLKKVVYTAMKQSLQFSLPLLHELSSFNDITSQEFEGQKFIAQCEFDPNNITQKTLQSEVDHRSDALVLIGPEGGFSPKEIELAANNDFIPVSLGATRLRTETAGIVAVHTINLKKTSISK